MSHRVHFVALRGGPDSLEALHELAGRLGWEDGVGPELADHAKRRGVAVVLLLELQR